jgi:hypothetical protein
MRIPLLLSRPKVRSLYGPECNRMDAWQWKIQKKDGPDYIKKESKMRGDGLL